jgi:thiosulfate/3-mercaptopyruvate sulfurtransferase
VKLKFSIFRLMVAAVLLGIGPWAGAQDVAQPKLRSEMLVTTAWLAEHLHDPGLVVLCVSSSAEFCAKGHIPGAREIRLSEIAITRDGIPNELPPAEKLQQIFSAAGMSNSSRVVLYGERYNLMAARAYFTLDYLGVAEKVSLLDGGIEKWVAEHRAVSTETPKVKAGTLSISPRAGILVDAAKVQSLSASKQVALIDARPTKEFTGEQLSEDVSKAGHIPGAKGLYWMDMLVSRENPVLKPEAELRRMYVEANTQQNQPLITYCRTGMQSSFDYFVAKYVGYEPSMYDGSFYEWSMKDLPAEASPHKQQ